MAPSRNPSAFGTPRTRLATVVFSQPSLSPRSSSAKPRTVMRNSSKPLLALEPHVLIGGVDRQRDQVDRVIRHPRPDPNQHARVPDRRKHHPIDRELLDAMEQDFPLRGVPLASLLLKQFVDVGITSIGIATLRVNERLHAGG